MIYFIEFIYLIFISMFILLTHFLSICVTSPKAKSWIMPKKGNGKYFKPEESLCLYMVISMEDHSHSSWGSAEKAAEAECREVIRCEVLPGKYCHEQPAGS